MQEERPDLQLAHLPPLGRVPDDVGDVMPGAVHFLVYHLNAGLLHRDDLIAAGRKGPRPRC